MLSGPPRDRPLIFVIGFIDILRFSSGLGFPKIGKEEARSKAMECPYCHKTHGPENPCMNHMPVPMSYWPTRSGMPEMPYEAEGERKPDPHAGN